MKGAALFLVLFMVVLLAQPGEGFIHLIGHAISAISSLFHGKNTKEQADQQQLDQMQLDQKQNEMQQDQMQLDQQQLDQQQKEKLDKRSLKDKLRQYRFN
ncbi:hypothetical protein CHARACLAT_029873 [Characodon lateralis]|uniref:Piscidin-4 n=1 Tax=Characodon lateralis TaxID=208331 RepID=A0ABU7DYJ5_9TELE|nr:hypothetical protein [Characodon lateralis]